VSSHTSAPRRPCHTHCHQYLANAAHLCRLVMLSSHALMSLTSGESWLVICCQSSPTGRVVRGNRWPACYRAPRVAGGRRAGAVRCSIRERRTRRNVRALSMRSHRVRCPSIRRSCRRCPGTCRPPLARRAVPPRPLARPASNPGRSQSRPVPASERPLPDPTAYLANPYVGAHN
jgi:hypothetical protein